MKNASCPCPYPCPEVHTNSALLSKSSHVSWRRGDELWRAGDGPGWMLAVCTGAVGLRRGGDARTSRLVDIVVRGQIAGEEVAVGADRPATCVGLIAGKGRLLPRRQLSDAVQTKPLAWMSLMTISTQRSATLAQALETTSNGTVATRLAALLLRLGERIGLDDARGLMVPLPLPRIDLANLVGCREETAVRQMRAWEEHGLVSTLKEGFVLRDQPALALIAAD
ncbi:MAG: Crp/Fnr family transcriptional regulator [Deltaproteobacteria bacterium]|nr:Crp/Fnr family transcriptional regulator [Deltaproteobacteria bacterium]